MMNNYSKIAKWTLIIEKLSRLTEARGATADEASLARLKIELLQHKITQLSVVAPEIPRAPITSTRFVWKTQGATVNTRSTQETDAAHKDWYILLKRIQRLNTSRSHR